MMSTPAPRRRWLVAAVALLATACAGGGDDTATSTASTAATTTTEASATTTEATTTTTSSTTSTTLPRVEVLEATAREGDLGLHVESDQPFIWATTDRDDICSPAEPAVAVFTAELDGIEPDDLLGVRAFFDSIDPTSTSTTTSTSSTTSTTSTSTTSTTTATGSSETGATTTTEPTDDRSGQRSLDFAVDDEGVWRVIVGPIEATTRSDRAMAVTVVARTADGDEIEADLELTVRAPEQCDGTNDDQRRRSLPAPVTLDVTTDPADGIVVGKEVTDCLGRPTQVGIRVQASGAVVGMTATGTLPDGTTVSRSLQARGEREFGLQLGPFSSPPAGDQAVATFTVAATDVYGTTAIKTVSITLVRPCVDPDDTTPDTTAPDDTTPDDPEFTVTISPNPLEIWATASGACPSGSTTFSVVATAPQRASSVVVVARSANGQQIERSLSYSNGAWRGSVGPFEGQPGMPERSTIDVQLRATVDGTTRTLQREGVLRRPSACDPGTPTTTTAGTAPATTTTQPSTVTTTTQTPTTTTAPTTTAAPTTTTTQPPAPPTITNATANPNPVPCSQAVTIGAQTSGVVDQVGAQFGGGQIALNRSGSNWRVDTTAPPNPGDYDIRITARNSATGQTDTTRVTLRVGC